MIPVAKFNYLLHPYHTFLVTCCDQEGKPNIITIAWLMPLSVQPPLVGLAIRTSRFSYGLIQENGEFVVNVPDMTIVKQVLFCGRRSGRKVDKFPATGLTPAPARHVKPPIIQECVAFLECQVQNEVEAGDHQLLIARVVSAYAKPGILTNDGLYDLENTQPVFHMGRDRFTTAHLETVEPTLPAKEP
jgi:flavin reductase (DIM6/NTAB) family NADH-FMN oxidoreductase RutF